MNVVIVTVILVQASAKLKTGAAAGIIPKFNLYEIHKMVKSSEGMKLLRKIISRPETVVYNYYIHAKGYFDEEGYNKFISSSEGKKCSFNDKTVFFRACPFVEPGKGCLIPVEYRSYICNFFVCKEVMNDLSSDSEYNNYIRERDNYVHWIEWENESMQAMLTDMNLNLIHNFDEVIKVLKDLPLENYEFPKLTPMINKTKNS